MSEPYKRKLIEVALPLDAINREAAREKSIRHGHPSTLHLWWARRPLAACRAVLFAQLVDDPSAHPEKFPTEWDQDAERLRLFGILEELVKWENSTNQEVLKAAREEILRSFDGDPPTIIDPFAGGGSIPLEAQRLGLTVHASDLNPVAVLINKALIEIPSRWAGRAPVHPDDGKTLGNRTWRGAQGLADDVLYYGQWLRDQTEQSVGHLYPKTVLPDGSQANVIAWIWVRTVKCPNPACGATMPLASTFWLGTRKGKEAWIQPTIDSKSVRFEVSHGSEGPQNPPKLGRGSKFGCLVCEQPAPDSHLKSEGMAGRMGVQLMAVVAEGSKKRVYLSPTDEHQKIALAVQQPDEVPTTELVDDPRAIRCKAYGIRRHADLFTSRQLTVLHTYSELFVQVRQMVERDAAGFGLLPEDAEHTHAMWSPI